MIMNPLFIRIVKYLRDSTNPVPKLIRYQNTIEQRVREIITNTTIRVIRTAWRLDLDKKELTMKWEIY